MTETFTESTVEEAALEWFAALGYAILHGTDIAPDELFVEPVGCTDVADENAPMRDALLPKLISGEIRIKDAESFVEGTL